MKTYLQSIGDYQVIEKLGRGGMADVYLALDTRNNRKIALKLVERSGGEEAKDILAAEGLGAQLQAHLCAIDARIPQIHSYGDIDDFFYIDMEYVEGRDLSEVIHSGAIDPQEASRIAAELCNILSVAHNAALEIDGRGLRAVVHGDIKPKNIRLDPANNVRVLDFGIAKGLSLTRKLTSNYFGSVSYSSPERLDAGRMDEMSDLWAVGVVLHEMISGQAPFDAPSTEGLERIVRARTPPLPLPKSCPLELQQIVFKALAQSPAKRYPTARDFECDLHAFLAGEPTSAARENEETRRTIPAELAQEPAPQPSLSSPGEETRRTRVAPKWVARGRMALKAGLPALLAFLALWEMTVYRNAAQLKPDFVTQQINGDQAWDQYQKIRQSSPVGLAPLVLRGPLKRLLLEQSQRIAEEYSNSDTPKTREGDWLRCQRYMLDERQLDSSDDKASAMVAYASGHIMRINRKDAEAISAFKHAASLNPKWPDPHLGMARVYIYGLKDFESGIQALKRAEDLGHKPGKRELAQRADALKNRGILYVKGAAQLADQPQEKDLLLKAKSDLGNALEIYAQIAPWGDSTAQVRQTQATLQKVQIRLAIVDPVDSIFSWRWWKRL